MRRAVYVNEKGNYFTSNAQGIFTVYLNSDTKALNDPKTDRKGRIYYVIDIVPKFTSKGNLVCIEKPVGGLNALYQSEEV